MASPQDAAAELLLRREGREDLLTFTVETHPSYMTGWHHREICRALMRVERGEIDRLMIFAPPRHGKSELVSLRFPAWYIGRHPERQIICASYNDDLAADFGRKVKSIISSDEYRRFFPDVSLSADAKAANRWHTTSGGIYVSAGLGGTLSGRGGHIIVVDDPIKNRDEADSKRIRDRLWEIYDSDIQSRLMPGGAIVVMHTRWHPDDLAGRLIDKMESGEGDRWTVISLPAIMNEGQDNEESLWPEAFPLDAMRRRRTNTDSRTWVSLYQQKPRQDGGDILRGDWFKRYRLGKHPDVHIYASSDYAVTPGGGDYTEHGIWGIDCDDNLWAIDWWYGQDTPDVWVDAQLDLAKKWRPLCWYGEAGAIRRAVEPMTKKRMRERNIFFRRDFIPSMTDKRIRANALQARASLGKVYIPECPWGDRLVAQLAEFPGRFDDAVDVASMIAQVVDRLAPACKPKPPCDQKVDKWDRAFARAFDVADSNRWKVI